MEDVHHLLDNAKEESYLFVVDSRTRDTSVWPSPSQYEISFASPFRNVFGMDLLDATVARTEYIVESNTNVLEYAAGQPASLEEWNSGAWVTSARRRTVTLDPGDYNIATFIEHLNTKLQAVATAAGEAAIQCVPVSNPAEVSNKIRLTCTAPFTLLMSASTLRHTLGFGDPVTTSTSDNYACVPGWSVNRTAGASDVFLSKPGQLEGVEPVVAVVGPLPVADNVSHVPVYGSRVLRQLFVSTATGKPSTVATYVTAAAAAGQSPPTLDVRIVRASDDVVIATGTLSATVDDPDSAYVPVSCTVSGTALLQADTQYRVEYSAASQGGSAQTYVGVYYNRLNVPVDGSSMTLDGAPINPGQNGCVDVFINATGNYVTSPGLVNLSGPRFVNIRCPEIESHMFRDRVNERCHAGLGMVSLRGYGFREQRFDFVSFPSRRFHPLGKLSKLTFRLERPDGSLYDSHGVDHTLLLVLKYYRGTGASPFVNSQLNPHYTPDLRSHLIESKWAAEARATDRIDTFYGP